MGAITLDRVEKRYPPPSGFHAVRGVSLDIAPGEFLVLLGPSGCGKSTTLRMIAGLEGITEGRILIDGRVVNDVHPKDRDIAMVFQNYALYPHMTVFENMAFALKLRKTPKAEIKARVNEAASMLGLTDLLARKPAALSGGQRQRVAVGRAIVRRPKAFLFDEPLSNLDAKLRTTTRGEIKALHQRLGVTTVYVTHDQEEAMTLGDRIVIMAGGVVQQAGPPLEVYQRPANRFVGAFIGMPPMNMLDGRLEERSGTIAFVAPGIDVPLPSEWTPKLKPHAGSMVTLGLRPQALRVAGPSEPGPGVSLKVELVEPLGEQVDITGVVSPGALRLVARVQAGATAAVGQAVRLGIEASRVHVFAPGEFGANLTLV